jgi:putative nucleotidyltransferase with HDIG domain
MINVLIYDHCRERHAAYRQLLNGDVYLVELTADEQRARSVITENRPDVFIAVHGPAPDGAPVWSLLTDFKTVSPMQPAILVADAADQALLRRGIYYGIDDCIEAGQLEGELLLSLARTLDRCRDLQANIIRLEKQRYEQEIERLHRNMSDELNRMLGLQQQLESSGQLIIKALVNAIEIADPYVRGHSQRVAGMAKRIASRMNQAYLLSHGLYRMDELEIAALLHDIGKIGIPDTILNKKHRLNEAEWQIIRRHPELGAEIVANVGNLSSVAADIRHHHERWDGLGYPNGLAGDAIPIRARILALSDTFDAMITPRVYRQARLLPDAVGEIRANSGKQFDPAVVDGILWIIGEQS